MQINVASGIRGILIPFNIILIYLYIIIIIIHMNNIFYEAFLCIFRFFFGFVVSNSRVPDRVH